MITIEQVVNVAISVGSDISISEAIQIVDELNGMDASEQDVKACLN